MSTDSTTSKTAFEGSRGLSLNDVCGGRVAKNGSQGRRKEEQVREIKSTIEETKICGSSVWMLCVDTGHGDPSSRSVRGPRRSSERWEVHEMEGYRDSGPARRSTCTRCWLRTLYPRIGEPRGLNHGLKLLILKEQSADRVYATVITRGEARRRGSGYIQLRAVGRHIGPV